MPPEMEQQYADTSRRRFMPFLRICLVISFIVEIAELFANYQAGGRVYFLEMRFIMMAFYTVLLAITYIPGALRIVHILGVIGITGVVFCLAFVTSYAVDGFERFLPSFLIPLQLVPVMTSFVAALATIWISLSIILDFARHSDLSNYAMGNVKNILMYYGLLSVVISYVATQYRRSAFKMEKKLEQARQEAEAANSAKSTFLATMSHEVRTPLNGILGLVTLLKDSKLDKKQKDYVETVKYSGETLLTILNDILDFSKMEAGKFEIEDIKFNLDRLIRSVVTLMKSRADEKNLVLDYKISGDIPPYIKSDPTRIRQVLLNLIGNAVKFTDQGFVHIHVTSLGRNDSRLTLKFEVSDTGIGIPEEAQKNLFQEFVQADSSTSRKYGGTGLGLAICKKIVGLMSGEIGIASREGEGSTFWFELPVEVASQSDNETENDEDRGVESIPAFKPLNILVAEDNKINQMVIAGLLKRAGLTPTMANNGEEALEFLSAPRVPYDLVLMDMQMPVMDGLAAAAKIRALNNDSKNIPIIALTANTVKGDEQRCLAAGMNGFVSKPIDPKTLYITISKHVPQAVIQGKSQKQDKAKVTNPAFENLSVIQRMMGADYVKKFTEDGLIEIESLIKSLSSAPDSQTMKNSAHNLKTLSGMFGLNDVHALAEGIEMCSADNSGEEARNLGRLLPERYRENVAALRADYLAHM